MNEILTINNMIMNNVILIDVILEETFFKEVDNALPNQRPDHDSRTYCEIFRCKIEYIFSRLSFFSSKMLLSCWVSLARPLAPYRIVGSIIYAFLDFGGTTEIRFSIRINCIIHFFETVKAFLSYK